MIVSRIVLRKDKDVVSFLGVWYRPSGGDGGNRFALVRLVRRPLGFEKLGDPVVRVFPIELILTALVFVFGRSPVAHHRNWEHGVSVLAMDIAGVYPYCYHSPFSNASKTHVA